MPASSSGGSSTITKHSPYPWYIFRAHLSENLAAATMELRSDAIGHLDEIVKEGANQCPGGLLPLWTTAFSRRTRLAR
jgi:hypothetical protein